MPSIIIPDLDMTLIRAIEFINGYCNKHTRCEEDGCRLWDDNGPRCLLRTDIPPCDWEPIIQKVADGTKEGKTNE